MQKPQSLQLYSGSLVMRYGLGWECLMLCPTTCKAHRTLCPECSRISREA